jgi:hypothetical protein
MTDPSSPFILLFGELIPEPSFDDREVGTRKTGVQTETTDDE